MKDNNLLAQNIDISLNIAQKYLNTWSIGIQDNNILEQAFGNAFDIDIVDLLIQNWQTENFLDFPKIEIVPRRNINNADGAYAEESQTIYLSQELVIEGKNEFIAAIILEEYGHHLDTLLNHTDTSGDEGAIFSALVRGKELTTKQLKTIRLEEDNALVILNGQPVKIEQAASFPYNESGAGNSTTVTLDTGGTQGTITLQFETYIVADRIQLFYEGGVLYDSGFVGTRGLRTITRDFSGDSSLIAIQMTPNIPNPDGTLWNFIAQAEVTECPDTGVLNIEAASGEFEDSDGDEVCEAEGTVYVGRSEPDATSRLISIDGTNPRYDDNEFQVENGVVYASINSSVDAPLFKANDLVLGYEPIIFDSFDEIEIIDDFTLAGLEIEFNRLRLDKNQIELQGDFVLPFAFGGFDVNLNAPNALIISSDDVRIDGGGINFPTEEFELFNTFSVKAEDVAIEYSPVGSEGNDELEIQGRFSLVTPFFKGSLADESGATIALDVSGSNYLRVVNGQAEISGEFSLEDVSLTNNFKINELSLFVTTDDGEITEAGGIGKVTLPFSSNPLDRDGIGIEASAEFLFPDSGIELNKISLEGSDLDIPVVTTGVFLQSIGGAIENIAPSSDEDTVLAGTIGLTYGTQVSIPLPSVLGGGSSNLAPISVKVDNATANSESVSGDFEISLINSDIFSLSGNGIEFNWNENTFGSDDLTLNAFGEIFNGNANFSFDFEAGEFTGLGRATVSFPDDPQFDIFPDYFRVKGKSIFNGAIEFFYTDNETNDDDYIKGEVNFFEDIFEGSDLVGRSDITAGFEYYFNGDFDLIFFEDIINFSAASVGNLQSNAAFEIQTLSSNSSVKTLPTQIESRDENILNSNSSRSDSTVYNQLANSESNSSNSFDVPSRTDYLVLTAKWTNRAQLAQIELIDPDGNVISESDFEQQNIKLQFDSDELVDRSSNSVRTKSAYIKSPAVGTWQIQVADSTGLGEISYSSYDGLAGRVVPEMTILPGIEQIDESRFKIDYLVEDPDSTKIRMDLHADSELGGYNGITIGGANNIPVTNGEGSYILDTEGIAPGEYYLYGVVEDGWDRRSSYIDGLSNYSSEKITVVRKADIVANITTNEERVVIGDNIVYTVTATNLSTQFDSRGVKMLVNLPINSELVSTSESTTEPESKFQRVASDLIFDVGVLQPGEIYSTQVVVKALADEGSTPGSLADAWVFLESETYDPNSEGSSYGSPSTVRVDIESQQEVDRRSPKPFLTIERIDTTDSGEEITEQAIRREFQRDEPYRYQVEITNSGEGAATGVVVKESLVDLEEVDLNEVIVTEGEYSYNTETKTLTVNIDEIAPGVTETITIDITPRKALKASGTTRIEYGKEIQLPLGTAREFSDEQGYNLKVLLPPIPPADLELSQTVDNPTPSVGDEINITLNLFNKGPGVAGQVEIRNLLPEGLTFVRADAGFGSYDSDTGIWKAGNIANDAGTSLTITALMEDISNITNIAGEDISSIVNIAEVISTNQPDPDSTPGNGDTTEDDFSAITITNIVDINEDTSITIFASELLGSYVADNLYLAEIIASIDGTAIINAEGNVEFTPDPNFNGIASFEYTVTDGENTNTTFANVLVRPINDPLIANKDNFTTDEDVSLTILASELFTNDVNDDIEKSLNVSSINNLVNGTATINSRGNLKFIPNLNFNGTASFDYTVTDGTDIETASVEIVVNAVNDLPVVNNDTFTIDEDIPLTITTTELLSNDTDLETPENLSITEVKNAVNGTVSLNEEGDIQFFREPNFNGTASFDYTVSDGTDTETGLVEIIVNPVNDTPFITTPLPDLNLPKNSPNSIINFADYFEDIEERDNLYYSVGVDNSSIFSSFEFEPGTEALVLDYADDFVGMATVIARVTDSEGEFAQDTFDITIFETVNTDTVTTDEDTSATIFPADLLSNDIGDNLSFVGVENAVNGTVVLNEEGNIEFTPDPNFDRTATFDYIIFDGTVNKTGLVEVIVNPINDVPFVTTPIPDLTLTRNPSTSIINYADYFEDVEDGDYLRYSVRYSTRIQGGTSDTFFNSISFDPSTRALLLDYADDVLGTATITAKVTDSEGEIAEDRFTVSIVDSNDLVANSDTVTTDEDTPTTIIATELLSNDEGENLSLVEVNNSANGTVSLNGEGNVEFTPDPNFDGTASFDYTITNDVENATASVSVIVNPINDAPVLVNPIPNLTVDKNAPNSIIELTNYFDDVENGSNLAYSVSSSSSLTGGTSGNFFDLFAIDPETKALILDYSEDVLGTSTITVKATDSENEFIETSFTVSVIDPVEPPTNSSTVGEYGIINNLTDELQTISLSNSFTNPVVFVQPLSYNESDPATVRLQDIESDSFNLSIQEPSNLDGIHTTEQVSYLVLEAGTWQLPNGDTLQVGTTTSDELISANWQNIAFTETFDATPAVFSQVQTNNDPDFVQTRQRNLSPDGFEFGMEEAEASRNSTHATEQLGWFALSEGSGNWNGNNWSAGNTANSITHNWREIDLSAEFTTAPQIFASMATYNGTDPAGVRYQNLDTNSVEVKISEDTTKDNETNHITERVSYFALEGAGLLDAVAIETLPILEGTNLTVIEGDTGNTIIQFSFNLDSPSTDDVRFNYTTEDIDAVATEDYLATSGTITIPAGSTNATIEVEIIGDTDFESDETFGLNLSGIESATFAKNQANYSVLGTIINDDSAPVMGEYGVIDNLTHELQTISLSNSFTNPVVFVQPLSNNESDPATVRLQDIQSNSFNLFIQEPSNLDGIHSAEQVSYLVLEAGNWQLPNGDLLQIGTVESDELISANWQSIAFTETFDATPAVFTQVQTNNDPDFVQTRQRNLTNNGFQFGMEEAEASKNSTHGSEQLGWFALSEGNGNWSSNNYQAGSTADTVTHNWSQIEFSSNFTMTPQFLASISRYDGIDPAGVRYQNLDANGVEVKISEDTTKDNETNHITEQVSFLALEGAGLLEAEAIDALPTLIGTDITVTEGDTGSTIVQFSFNLDSPSTNDVRFNYTTEDIDAVATEDYLATSGTMTIPAGSTNATIEVEIIGDTNFESDETFSLNLSEIESAIFAENQVNYSVLGTITNDDSAPVMGEYGIIDNLTDERQTISLTNSFTNPVVFVQPLSNNESDPATARLQDIESDSFDLFIQEPSNLDGIHTTEQVSYLVLEAGTWQLPNGDTLEVGTTSSDELISVNWQNIAFTETFDATPAVFTQVQTNNDPDFVQTRQRNITNNGFEFGMEEAEASKNSTHATEQLGWFALSEGSGNWNGNNYQAGTTANSITNNWSEIDFDSEFTTTPQLLASMATYDGTDPAGVRYQNIDANSVEVKISEDTTKDNETNHTTEKVSYFALEGAGLLEAEPIALLEEMDLTVAGEETREDNLIQSKTETLFAESTNNTVEMINDRHFGEIETFDLSLPIASLATLVASEDRKSVSNIIENDDSFFTSSIGDRIFSIVETDF